MLFLLLMQVSNYYRVRDSWREFQGTQIELQSLDLLGSSLILQRDRRSEPSRGAADRRGP